MVSFGFLGFSGVFKGYLSGEREKNYRTASTARTKIGCEDLFFGVRRHGLNLTRISCLRCRIFDGHRGRLEKKRNTDSQMRPSEVV
jgi:hypothetical protein